MISNYFPSAQEEVIRIADQTMGVGYFTEQEIQSLLGQNCIALVDNENDAIRGFCFAFILSPEELKNQHNISIDFPGIENQRQIGLLKTIATDPAHRKKGVASGLIQKLIQNLEEKEIRVIICPAWKTGNEINLGGLLLKNDFHPVKEIPDYWFEDSLLKKYPCPECGQPPCRCKAIIFQRVKKD